MTRAADVVVLGGGLIGCAVARELRRRGAGRVVVLERGRAGAEASRAAAGMVAPQAECEVNGPVLPLGVESRRRYAEWAAAIERESRIDVEYRTDGIVYAMLRAADARVLGARARWQERLGLRVEWLDARSARRLVPALAPGVHGALLFPDDHRVNNERLAVAVARAARRAGVVVMEDTPASAIRARGGRVAAVRTADGAVETPVVVNATGAWAGRIRLPAGAVPPPVFPVRGQMLVLRPAPGVLRRPLYCLGGYCVPREDGRVLAGSTLERVGFEKRVTAGAAADILAAARAMAPALADATLESSWAGLRPGTTDHRPIIGRAADVSGLFYATGHYRSGILLAPATAVAIADLVLDGRTALPLGGLEPSRF